MCDVSGLKTSATLRPREISLRHITSCFSPFLHKTPRATPTPTPAAPPRPNRVRLAKAINFQNTSPRRQTKTQRRDPPRPSINYAILCSTIIHDGTKEYSSVYLPGRVQSESPKRPQYSSHSLPLPLDLPSGREAEHNNPKILKSNLSLVYPDSFFFFFLFLLPFSPRYTVAVWLGAESRPGARQNSRNFRIKTVAFQWRFWNEMRSKTGGESNNLTESIICDFFQSDCSSACWHGPLHSPRKAVALANRNGSTIIIPSIARLP